MDQVSTSDDACTGVQLNDLIETFYSSPDRRDQLADFDQVSSVPSPFDQLLDHNEHMTTTVEAFHGELVDVNVLEYRQIGKWYVREILLLTQQTRKVVQYGIVRLDTQSLAPEVWKRIRSREVPLGRVLIEHNVLRKVNLCRLWKVQVGRVLANHLELPQGETIYGRTALIHCDDVPAIELLEVVTR